MSLNPDMSRVDTLVAEASTLVEAGSYAAAVKKLEAAQTLIALVPKTRGPDGAEIEFKTQQIDQMIDRFNRKASASSLKIVPVRPGSRDCWRWAQRPNVKSSVGTPPHAIA